MLNSFTEKFYSFRSIFLMSIKQYLTKLMHDFDQKYRSKSTLTPSHTFISFLVAIAKTNLVLHIALTTCEQSNNKIYAYRITNIQTNNQISVFTNNRAYSRSILHSTIECWPPLQKLCKVLF